MVSMLMPAPERLLPTLRTLEDDGWAVAGVGRGDGLTLPWELKGFFWPAGPQLAFSLQHYQYTFEPHYFLGCQLAITGNDCTTMGRFPRHECH